MSQQDQQFIGNQFQGEDIINVWEDNLEEEIEKISDYVQQGYSYISMDTEFPGILYTQQYDLNMIPEQGYQYLKKNVDSMQVIQIGICLSD